MAEVDDRLARLSSALYSPDRAIDTLVVDGFQPEVGQAWRPRQAAVLVPIVLGPEPAVILTVRSDAMSSHAGQVALPGGRRSGQEPFPVTTALREAAEETGIAPADVQVLGLMRRFDTISAYRIVPVVGVLSTPPRLRPCPREVRAVFEVPLGRVFDPLSYRRHRVWHRHRSYEVWSMLSERWPIWGATASILGHMAGLASGRSS